MSEEHRKEIVVRIPVPNLEGAKARLSKTADRAGNAALRHRGWFMFGAFLLALMLAKAVTHAWRFG